MGAYKRNHSVYNKVKYNRAKAICRHVFAEAKKSSWKKYASSINCRTGLHKVWKRVHKIAGRFTSAPPPVLRSAADDVIHSPREVADELANYFVGVSNTGNHSPDFTIGIETIPKQHVFGSSQISLFRIMSSSQSKNFNMHCH